MFGDYSSVGFTVPGMRVTSRPCFRFDDCTDNRTDLQPGKSQQHAGNVSLEYSFLVDCNKCVELTLLQYNQLKQRNRSRSGSSLVSVGGQQRQHPPPLVSHASDPALATSLPLISTNSSSPSASTSTLQPLLAQLLTSKY
jgi:hypothetical protein